MGLNDPGNAQWYIDLSAPLHLHDDSSILQFVIDKCTLPLVLDSVGSESPIIQTGYTTLTQTNPYHTLSLNNVIITPQII